MSDYVDKAAVDQIVSALERLNYWLDDYVTQQNKLLGRSGAICPFVAPSHKNNALEIRIRLTGDNPTFELLHEIAINALSEFRLTNWKGRNPMLHALIVVLPDLDVEKALLLDDVHAAVKDEFVEQGIMVGQFHPKCTVTSARNDDFEVSRAPVPALAIRNLAIHDIFFLGEKEAWFRKYQSAFGKYYEKESTGIDPTLIEHFSAAQRRFPQPAGDIQVFGEERK